MLSDLKLPMAGGRKTNGDRAWTASYGIYWSGSVVPSDGNNSTVSNARDIFFGGYLGLLDTSSRGYGYSVRCIKDQTPTERSASILKVIGNDHNNNKSTVTVAQLKAILPALRDINDDYQDIYRSYIVSANNDFSSPATIGEVQSMIDAMNALNLPEHAILDRSFFKKTNGIFEHRFVYLPVTNSTTGKTWLNNNLGADYANVDSSDYNPSQQAMTVNDRKASGSAFQWGRKADGHELMDWTPFTIPDIHDPRDTPRTYYGKGKYGETKTPADEPSHSLFILSQYDIARYDWRVNHDDTLWAGESSPNNVCPIGYRLPLSPNAGDDAPADDGKNEWYVEMSTWSSQDRAGSFASELKLSVAGNRSEWHGYVFARHVEEVYWAGTEYNITKYEIEMRKHGSSIWIDIDNDDVDANNNSRKANGNAVRCIKD